MDKKERLKKQLDFIMEIDKVKNIFRQTYLADGKRKENFDIILFRLLKSGVFGSTGNN